MDRKQPAPVCRRSAASEARSLAASLIAGGLPLPDDLVLPEREIEDGPCAALRWASSGAMWLTGWPGAAPLAPSAPVMSRIEGARLLLAELSGRLGCAVNVDIPALMSGRAAEAGWGRQGRTSAGGSCRLIAASDGWVAVNLARPSDVDAVEAMAGAGPVTDPWPSLGRAAGGALAAEFVERAQLLGVPAAALGAHAGPPCRTTAPGPAMPGSRSSWTVIDLSAMWAGPLCAQQLGRAGARVVKVESTVRPDGGRLGSPAFYDWLHAGHASVAFDLTAPAGRGRLRSLLDGADVVIEASRPRALSQLGVDAEEFVRSRPGRTWVSLTGYGREGPWSNRVAFGDDAAVAGGLVAYDVAGDPVFCADAAADPIAGLFAAVAVVASVVAGGGHLLDVSMAGVAAHVAVAAGPAVGHPVASKAAGRWTVHHGSAHAEVARPRPLPPAAPARSMGADNRDVLADNRADRAGRLES